MPRVAQPNSLNTQYAQQQVDQQRTAQRQANQDNQPRITYATRPRVEAAPAGPPRVRQNLGKFQRFSNRVTHSYRSFKAALPRLGSVRADRIQNQRGIRFNSRLENFSQRVNTGVTQLSATNGKLEHRKESLLTIQNDAKLLASDNPNVDEFDVVNARLDVELEKLSDTELSNFYNNVSHKLNQLSGRTASSLRYSDQIRILQHLASAAIRHQVARSDAAQEFLDAVNTNDPADVSQRDQVKAQAETLNNTIRDRLVDEVGLSGKKLERHAQYNLSKVVQTRLARNGAGTEQLGKANRNLLNVADGLRKDIRENNRQQNLPTKTKQVEIYQFSQPLRTVNRAVRESFLLAKAGEFRDENVNSRYEPIGAGAAHTVSKLTYDHVSQVKVYKGDDETTIHDADKNLTFDGDHRFSAPLILGIDQSSPRLLERAELTSRYADRLNFNVVAKTNYASHQGKPGIVQDLAPGKPAATKGLLQQAVDTDKAAVQKQLTQLHLLDLLTGQADRHRNNYLISVQGNQVSVTGIDSDYSFGTNVKDPNVLVDNEHAKIPGLPNVVDRDSYGQIQGLTDGELRSLIGDSLSDAEVDAAIGRLHAVQEHLQGLEQAGRVIEPNQWGTTLADDLLEDLSGRDRALDAVAQGFAVQDQALRQEYQRNLDVVRDQANQFGIQDAFDTFVNEKRDSQRFPLFEESREFRRLKEPQRQQLRGAIRALDSVHRDFFKNSAQQQKLQALRQESQELRDQINDLNYDLTPNLPPERRQAIEREIRHKTWDFRQNNQKLHRQFDIPQSGYYARDLNSNKPSNYTPTINFSDFV